MLQSYTICPYGWLDALFPHFHQSLDGGWPEHSKSSTRLWPLLKCEHHSQVPEAIFLRLNQNFMQTLCSLWSAMSLHYEDRRINCHMHKNATFSSPHQFTISQLGGV